MFSTDEIWEEELKVIVELYQRGFLTQEQIEKLKRPENDVEQWITDHEV